tara:strand:+ start:44 stop:700 length:657 start_codon:yes stop_codon:yes gene_type:complete
MKNFVIKLTKFRLFIIMLTTLFLSTLGFSIKEYFESKIDTSKKDKKGDRINEALEKGKDYDPFNDANKGTVPAVPQTIPQNCPTHHHDPDGKHWPKSSTRPSAAPSDVPAVPQKPPVRPVDMSKYVLKSEIIPPVCPKCPESRSCLPSVSKCPPCKPCGRCPEAQNQFECKKVPNYSISNSISNKYNIPNNDMGGSVTYGYGDNRGPKPVLNSFAQFN